MTRHLFSPLLPLLAAAFPLAAHATNGYFSHGYGARSEGVAGVGIALPQDGLAGAANPAGTALLDDRLDVGLDLFRPRRGATIEGNGAGLDGRYDGDGRRLFAIPSIGWVQRLDERWSAGVAVYGNGGMNTSYDRSPYSAFGVTGRSGVNLEQLFVSPSLAWRATPTQTLGVAVNLAYQRFSADGLGPFTAASSSPANVSGRGTDTSTGAGLRLGWLWQPAPEWRLGATWSSRIHGRFDKYRGLFADEGRFYIPANWGLGVAFDPAPGWTLAADYQVIEYSGVGAVANPIERLAAGRPLGSDGGPGFGWRDVKVLKAGIVQRWSPALTLRAGFSRATQAVPASQTFFNVLAPGVVQNHLTAGFSWATGERTEWSAFYAHAFGKTVRGRQSVPAGFGGGEADVRLSEDILGASWTWRF
ncbi:OmpP1/FadL family transporter [Rubrivivax gelatinosus]|uniref:Long-chain fatty acid transport protein n=1 Tax=Rubrivivax gelatinosus (strain NBRC 100245 / IL144) TaxID=983917 RepID=I0HS83_RUBGI|nr:outer membrane protein transport protein [Rubrivivax gelatinosus]BAL95870.1 hypothetical protein RGE_25290 [Rubrivivax gelatinosus IL144]